MSVAYLTRLYCLRGEVNEGFEGPASGSAFAIDLLPSLVILLTVLRLTPHASAVTD